MKVVILKDRTIQISDDQYKSLLKIRRKVAKDKFGETRIQIDQESFTLGDMMINDQNHTHQWTLDERKIRLEGNIGGEATMTFRVCLCGVENAINVQHHVIRH